MTVIFQPHLDTDTTQRTRLLDYDVGMGSCKALILIVVLLSHSLCRISRRLYGGSPKQAHDLTSASHESDLSAA